MVVGVPFEPLHVCWIATEMHGREEFAIVIHWNEGAKAKR
jgi:hypothetical protein